MKRETMKAFKARMQRLAGIEPRETSRRTGSWMRFHCGDHVSDRADERHTGIVKSITNGVVNVKWDDSEWISEHSPDELFRLHLTRGFSDAAGDSYAEMPRWR